MWTDKYLETRVLTASPLELVNIMYEHTIRSVQDARKHLATKDVVARTNAVRKALSLINELRGSLNHEVGGDLSRKLESLYEYMQKRITDGNMKKQDEPFAEVEVLLEQLAGAWSDIATGTQPETTFVEQPVEETPREEYANMPWSAPFASEGQFERSATYWSA